MPIGRLTRVVRVRGVDVYVHWTLFLIVAVLLWRPPRAMAATFAGIGSYLGLLLLHESGHLLVARIKGYEAFSVALYPIFGLATMELPESRLDRALIAWGGVLAQAAVAVPILLGVSIAGYPSSEALSAVLLILGGYSLASAGFNLLPIRPLDGATAWDVIPAWLEWKRRGPHPRP